MSDTVDSVLPLKIDAKKEVNPDPILTMVAIAENKNLSPSDKAALINYAQTRFLNRRRMAYIALYALVASLALLMIAGVVDGMNTDKDIKILVAIKEGESIIIWLEGFLATIVAAYYGVSAWSPNS